MKRTLITLAALLLTPPAAPSAQDVGPALLDLASRYGASYIVLPARPIRRTLVPAYRAKGYAIYRALRGGN